MDDFNLSLKSFSEDRSLQSDFEDRVYAKIKRKKNQRKIGYSAVAAFFFGLAFLLSSWVFQGPASPDQLQVKANQGMEQKEEIPLIEDLYYAASDKQTSYLLEQVSRRSKKGDF